MKRAWSYLLLLLLTLNLVGCDQTDDGSYVKPITIYEKVAGTWNLSSVKMVDEIAKAKNATISDVTLTSKLGFAGLTLQFSVDQDGNPSTYQIKGDAPKLIEPQGYWALSTPFPNTNGTSVKVNLYKDAAKTQLADQVLLTAIPGTQATLEFKLVRYNGTTAYVSYVYQFAQATK